MRQKILSNFPWLAWLAVFLFTRLLFLTRLPIFNDEAIYLDWGWQAWQLPGHWFYALWDGKQPLLIWIFGFLQFSGLDPLWVGRLWSVLMGVITWFGLVQIAKKYFTHQVAWWSSWAYLCIPLFVFFDRQALMEATLSAVTVWLVLLFLNLVYHPQLKTALWWGVVLGLGLWTKSTIFMVGMAVMVTRILWAPPQSSTLRQQFWLWWCLGVIVSIFLLVPLLWQPNFSLILARQSRFSLTLTEIIALPWSTWWYNAHSLVELLWWHLTPGMFLLTGLGMVVAVKPFFLQAWGKNTQKSLPPQFVGGFIVLWQLLIWLGFVLTVRTPSPRYLVSLSPLVCVLIGIGFNSVHERLKLIQSSFLRRSALSLALLIPISALSVSALLIWQPPSYFQIYQRFTRFSQQSEYVTFWPSGYGVAEAIDIIVQHTHGELATIWLRPDAGNPENSISLYLHSQPNLRVTYLHQAELDRYLASTCSQPLEPLYFVSRDTQLMDIEQLFREIDKTYKPGKQSFIGVYQVLPRCTQ